MKIRYKQRYGITVVSLFDNTLVGLTSIRKGDKYDKNVGFAIALVKAHNKLNKREQKLYDSLDEIQWKTINVPLASVGKIVMVQLQYRQAVGHTKNMYKITIPVEGEEDHVFFDDFNIFDQEYIVQVTQNEKLVCEVAEAFGRRLLKMAVL